MRALARKGLVCALVCLLLVGCSKPEQVKIPKLKVIGATTKMASVGGYKWHGGTADASEPWKWNKINRVKADQNGEVKLQFSEKVDHVKILYWKTNRSRNSNLRMQDGKNGKLVDHKLKGATKKLYFVQAKFVDKEVEYGFYVKR